MSFYLFIDIFLLIYCVQEWCVLNYEILDFGSSMLLHSTKPDYYYYSNCGYLEAETGVQYPSQHLRACATYTHIHKHSPFLQEGHIHTHRTKHKKQRSPNILYLKNDSLSFVKMLFKEIPI